MQNLPVGWQKAQRAWELLLNGKKKAAFKLLKEAVQDDPTLPTLTSVGTAFLLAEAIEDAKAVFDRMIERFPEVDGSYLWSGVARWLSDDAVRAVQLWEEGLDARYRDAAGGMDIPLLLYFAAVRRPDVADVTKFKKILAERLKSSWAKNWPAPLGKYVLGKITEVKLRKEAIDRDDEHATIEQTARVNFYVGVVALERGDKKAYEEDLRLCAEIPDLEDMCEYHLAAWENNKTRL